MYISTVCTFNERQISPILLYFQGPPGPLGDKGDRVSLFLQLTKDTFIHLKSIQNITRKWYGGGGLWN